VTLGNTFEFLASTFNCMIFRRSLLLFCVFFITTTPTLFAQDTPENENDKNIQLDFSEPAKYQVLGISVVGNSTISEKDILARFPIQVGQEITIPSSELSDAIKRLWKQKLFSDIRVEIDRKTFEGVFLSIKVKEYPVLTQVVFEGNSEFDEEELFKKAELTRGATITDQMIYLARQRLLKFYEQEGYLLCEIDYELRETKKGRATLFFKIKENDRVIIERINFVGNKAFDKGELLGTLEETKQLNFWRRIFSKPILDRKKYDDDKDKLVTFYRENGYRDAYFIRDSIYYTPDKRGLHLTIFLYEGPKYVLRNVQWEGNTLYTDAELSAVFGYKKGDVYNEKKIMERLTYSPEGGDIGSLYQDRGYLTFRADKEETVVEGDSIDLKIFITEGKQFRIRNVNIVGNTKTKDRVIRRELYTIPGDLYSRENIIRSIRQIAQLNYFDQEKITPDIQPKSEEEVDITYNVSEKSTDTFNASAGYSGAIGFTGALGLTFNNFSIQDITKREAYTPLPHGDGQRLDFQWQFGRFNFQTLSLSFTEPWAFGTPTSLGFSIFDTRQNFGQELQQTGISFSVGRRLTFPDDYFRIDYTFRFQRNRVGASTFGTFQRGLFFVTADEYSIIQTISRNSTDNPIYPRRGSDFSFATQLSGGPLPGTVDFLKLTLRAGWFSQLAGDLVLTTNADFGALDRIGNRTSNIPAVNFFFMGGSGISFLPTIPLRGYPDQGLGVFDPDLRIFTGNFYTKFQTELRYPISLNPQATVYVLLFAEAGNVYANASRANFADLKRAAGVGVRVFLPIVGLIGLDYGFGLDPVPSNPGRPNQGWNFIFTFGQFAR
jgi:outer membrane protein insertion porin family